MLMAAPRFGKPQSEFGEEIQALESRAFAHGLPCHHHRYQLIEQHVIEFNRLALSKADMRTDDMFNRVMPFDNISSVCLLESRATDSRLVMVNAHIHWDPTYRDPNTNRLTTTNPLLPTTGMGPIFLPLSAEISTRALILRSTTFSLEDKFLRGTRTL
jgi:hypothetical protein